MLEQHLLANKKRAFDICSPLLSLSRRFFLLESSSRVQKEGPYVGGKEEKEEGGRAEKPGRQRREKRKKVTSENSTVGLSRVADKRGEGERKKLDASLSSAFHSSIHLSRSPRFRRAGTQLQSKRARTRRSLEPDNAVMLRSGSSGEHGRRGSDDAAAAAAPAANDENENVDLDLDDVSSPPLPADPAPHAALTVLCRKAATEAVLSIIAEKSSNESSDLEAALALGRLALVLSSSSSSSPPPPRSCENEKASPFSASASSSLREEYRPLLNAALAASNARSALGSALVRVCRKAGTQDGLCADAVAAEAEGLLQAGAPLEFATEHGDTALIVSASKGCPELVQMLLRRGADPGGNTKSCTPPIHAAIEGANVDCFGEIFGSHGECVRLLLEAGVDPHARDVPRGKWKTSRKGREAT